MTIDLCFHADFLEERRRRRRKRDFLEERREVHQQGLLTTEGGSKAGMRVSQLYWQSPVCYNSSRKIQGLSKFSENFQYHNKIVQSYGTNVTNSHKIIRDHGFTWRQKKTSLFPRCIISTEQFRKLRKLPFVHRGEKVFLLNKTNGITDWQFGYCFPAI